MSQIYKVIDDFDGIEKYKPFLQELMSDRFDLYKVNTDTLNQDYFSSFFGHTIQDRVEDNWGYFKINLIPSLYFPILNLLFDVARQNGIENFGIGRCAVNASFASDKFPPIHVDHEFPHIQMVMYLNDSDGDTILYEKKFGEESSDVSACNLSGERESMPIITKVSPKKNRILLFDGSHYHSMYNPTKNLRYTLVANFYDYNLDMSPWIR